MGGLGTSDWNPSGELESWVIPPATKHMTATTEMVITEDQMDRIKYIGEFDYKSKTKGFDGKKFKRYSVKGVTFRAHTERDAQLITDLEKKGTIHTIYLMSQGKVVIGQDAQGADIEKELWDVDGYTPWSAYLMRKKGEGIAKQYSEGKFDAKASMELVDLEEAGA